MSRPCTQTRLSPFPRTHCSIARRSRASLQQLQPNLIAFQHTLCVDCGLLRAGLLQQQKEIVNAQTLKCWEHVAANDGKSLQTKGEQLPRNLESGG
jgi:hypothetical protein